MAQSAAAIREMREKQQNLVTQAREQLAKITDETSPADRSTYEAGHDKAMAEYDRLQASIDREERVAAAEAALETRDVHRPLGGNVEAGAGSDADKAKAIEARKAAFNAMLRYGESNLTPEERKALGGFQRLNDGVEGRAQGLADSTAGGYGPPRGRTNT